jgi:hypothetical protein
MGGDASLCHIFKLGLPSSTSFELRFVESGTFCTPCTVHTCSIYSENVKVTSFDFLISKYMQTEPVLFLLQELGAYLFMEVSSNKLNFTFHASRRHSSIHRLLPRTIA